MKETTFEHCRVIMEYCEPEEIEQVRRNQLSINGAYEIAKKRKNYRLKIPNSLLHGLENLMEKQPEWKKYTSNKMEPVEFLVLWSGLEWLYRNFDGTKEDGALIRMSL